MPSSSSPSQAGQQHHDPRDTAYLELVYEGFFAESGARLVIAVVSQVADAARSRASYPNLEERWEWFDDDLADAAHEFMTYLATSGKLSASNSDGTHPAREDNRVEVRDTCRDAGGQMRSFGGLRDTAHGGP